MAHAGTSTTLNRPANAADRFWQVFIAAILIVGMAGAIVGITTNLASHPTPVPAANPAYQIQSQPGLDVHKVVGHKGAMIYQ
jgi:hypothetical protein